MRKHMIYVKFDIINYFFINLITMDSIDKIINILSVKKNKQSKDYNEVTPMKTRSMTRLSRPPDTWKILLAEQRYKEDLKQ